MSAPEGLNALDPGVRMLGRELAGTAPAESLLVHCGDLPGLSAGATRVVLDVREHTGSLHDCIPATLSGDPLADRTFSTAACWPRAHLGIDFSMSCLAYGATHLRVGGRLLCSARKQKGGKRLGGVMERLLGNLEVLDRDRGYHLYASRLDESMDAQLAAELIGRSYEIGDTRLAPLVLEARPGVFSRKQLDPGTAELIDHVSQTKHDPARVIDLCAGIGPLALWAARRYERARVMAIDSNYLAVELLERNANKAGLDARVEAVVSDGLLGLDVSRRAGWAENADLVLINPPTHAEPDGLRQLLGGVAGFLAPQGVALAVVNRPGRASEAFAAAGLVVNTIRHGAYWIVEARRPSAQ